MTSFKNGPLGSQSIAVRLLLREAPSRAEAAAAAVAGIGEAGSWFMGSTAKAAGRIRGVELWRESAAVDEIQPLTARRDCTMKQYSVVGGWARWRGIKLHRLH